MPTRINGLWVRRATRMTIGTSSTTPISKNIGRPMIAAMRAIAQGSARSPTRLRIGVDDLVRTAGVGEQLAEHAARGRPGCRRLPNVVPKPLVKLVTMSAGATRATPPMTAVPSISAMNGWNFAAAMSSTTVRMPSTRQSAAGCARRR